MTGTFVYSPQPMKAYRLAGTDQCETRVIEKHMRRDAIWNLFWLSTPGIDKLPGSGSDWWRHYKAIPGGSAAIITDVLQDEPLYRKLLMHPRRFAQWFETLRDHDSFSTYEVLKGKEWVNLVIERSYEAAERMFPLQTPAIDWSRYGRSTAA